MIKEIKSTNGGRTFYSCYRTLRLKVSEAKYLIFLDNKFTTKDPEYIDMLTEQTYRNLNKPFNQRMVMSEAEWWIWQQEKLKMQDRVKRNESSKWKIKI